MHRLLQFFTYAHLPAALQAVSKPFCDLAQQLAATLPGNAESTFCLRELLLAKDAAVRSMLFNEAVPFTESLRKTTEVASEMAALRAGTTSVKATHPRELARLAEEVELKARQADAYARAEQQQAQQVQQQQPATQPSQQQTTESQGSSGE